MAGKTLTTEGLTRLWENATNYVDDQNTFPIFNDDEHTFEFGGNLGEYLAALDALIGGE